MGWVSDVSLLDGWLPTTVTWIAAIGAAVLLGTRSRRYLLMAVPICIALAACATGAMYVFVEDMWQPFPDALSITVYLWFGLAVLVLLVVVPRMVVSSTMGERLAALLGAIAVLVAAVGAVNMSFAYLPTVGTAVALGQPDASRLSSLPARGASVPLSQWRRDQDVPARGRIVTTKIAAPRSGFHARSALIYLPPAYFTSPRPLLPVLVLLAGQPGEPNDWLRGGKLVTTMDRYAAQHHGLTPVVVVADGTGSTLGNPLCVDSRLGNVATYLAVDVPTWVRNSLQVDQNSHALAVGGLSYGGTCAFQLATNYPSTYPTFLDISGQIEPTLGDKRRTLTAAFEGSQQRFDSVNPQTLLTRNRYPDSFGIFVAGSSDSQSQKALKTLRRKAAAAGMTVEYSETPGAHDFRVWSVALRVNLPELAERLGLPR